MRKRVVILASGQGTLAQAIIDAADLEIQIVAVVSDRADAHVLDRAKKASINTAVVELTNDRQLWNKRDRGRCLRDGEVNRLAIAVIGEGR